MVILESVLVDTDILIKSFRGDKTKQINLKHLKDKYRISVITACELINGAKSIKQRGEFMKVLRYYNITLVDEKISEQAFSLYKKYSLKNDMAISDSFIAATAILHDLFLYTDNKKDFDFIKGIKFYKEK
ncbi:MAG: type II toxin-antitoxin system VapC family toxin [Ginsengibacter sp.]